MSDFRPVECRIESDGGVTFRHTWSAKGVKDPYVWIVGGRYHTYFT
ncbi:MAG: hypothetical protein ACYC1C_05275 [Chloroflexota bacterium]